jgi:FkbM family methyltransferase
MPWIAEESKKLLELYPNQKLFCTLLWSLPGVMREFYIAGNNGSSSSTLKPFLISASHPEVQITQSVFLETSTLDQLMDSEVDLIGCGNILILDTQGAELNVIQGGINSLNQFDYVVAEVSLRELYSGATNFMKFSEEMKKFGYTLVAAEINRATGWGDALYIEDSIFLTQELCTEVNYSGRKLGIRTVIRSILMRLKRKTSELIPARK